MRLIAVINLPVILLALAFGSFALPRGAGEDPYAQRSSTFFSFTAIFFVKLVDRHRLRFQWHFASA